MLENQTNKGSENNENITYTREFQIKHSQKHKEKKSWKKLIIPLIIISAVAVVTIVLLFTLKLVEVKIGD